MRNNVHITDTAPIEEECDCYCCRNFSRGAIRHYFNVGEMLGPILLSIHNLRFYQLLMNEIRANIAKNCFAQWAEQQVDKYRQCCLIRNNAEI